MAKAQGAPAQWLNRIVVPMSRKKPTRRIHNGESTVAGHSEGATRRRKFRNGVITEAYGLRPPPSPPLGGTPLPGRTPLLCPAVRRPAGHKRGHRVFFDKGGEDAEPRRSHFCSQIVATNIILKSLVLLSDFHNIRGGVVVLYASPPYGKVATATKVQPCYMVIGSHVLATQVATEDRDGRCLSLNRSESLRHPQDS
jgi:hypothetical protein